MPPIGSCEKTSGIVTKTRPGPALGSWPSAKTAGMIINPARIAVCTESQAIQRDELGRSVLSLT